jgi:hypothetical protein
LVQGCYIAAQLTKLNCNINLAVLLCSHAVSSSEASLPWFLCAVAATEHFYFTEMSGKASHFLCVVLVSCFFITESF